MWANALLVSNFRYIKQSFKQIMTQHFLLKAILLRTIP